MVLVLLHLPRHATNGKSSVSKYKNVAPEPRRTPGVAPRSERRCGTPSLDITEFHWRLYVCIEPRKRREASGRSEYKA